MTQITEAIERHFCERCGKRLGDYIHTCTPPVAPVQEPHSWYSVEHDEWMTDKTRKEHEHLNSYTHRVGGFDLPLYTTPPEQRVWVDLTEEDIKSMDSGFNSISSFYAGALWANAKLKEKNT